MSEELERKYLAVIQESLMEKLELREENKKLKEKLDNIAWRENVKNTNLDIVLEDLKMSIDGKYNENTKESKPESDKYYIIDLDSCKYLVEDSNGYTLDKDKATIFSYQNALSIVSLSNKNFVTQRVNETK